MKRKAAVVAFTAIAVLAITLPLTAWARTQKTASPSPEASASPTPSATAKPQRVIPFHGMILAVDAKAKTFTIGGKQKSRVLMITDKTVLTKAGNPTTMSDVVPDEEARGSYWKQADGPLEVKNVKLGPLTKQEKAARKAKRAEKKEKPSSSPAASASAKP